MYCLFVELSRGQQDYVRPWTKCRSNVQLSHVRMYGIHGWSIPLRECDFSLGIYIYMLGDEVSQAIQMFCCDSSERIVHLYLIPLLFRRSWSSLIPFLAQFSSVQDGIYALGKALMRFQYAINHPDDKLYNVCECILRLFVDSSNNQRTIICPIVIRMWFLGSAHTCSRVHYAVSGTCGKHSSRRV